METTPRSRRGYAITAGARVHLEWSGAAARLLQLLGRPAAAEPVYAAAAAAEPVYAAAAAAAAALAAATTTNTQISVNS